PTITFRWSFTIRQSGRVSRLSGSSSTPRMLARTTPGAARTRARMRSAAARGAACVLTATRDLAEQPLDPIEMRRPRKTLGAGARRRGIGSVLAAERADERRAERAGVFRVRDDERRERTLEQLGGAHAPAGYDRDAGGARFEDDVSERLLPRRQAHDVRGGEHGADVVARSGEDDAPVECLGLAAVAREPFVVADDDEDGVGRRRLAPKAQQDVEPLPCEARSDRRADPVARGHTERAPDARTVRRPPGRMEALEVDAVVDDGDPGGGDAVVRRDLLTDPARHRQHVTMTAGCELACLEPQDGAMVRAAAVAAEPRRLRGRRPVAASVRTRPRGPSARGRPPAARRARTTRAARAVQRGRSAPV